ncbi:MAG: chromate transporter [Defluviitaleaceae bacterium]|nr:chromate transporter [Defluviitaleaceae bacterium]
MKDFFSIFINFAMIGTLTIGGGYTMLPLLQKTVADKLRWVTEEEITDFYAIAQCLPGIIAVNTAMLIGHRHKKIPGMVAAALGIIFPSLIFILAIAIFINRFMEYEIVRSAFNGIRAAVIAIVVHAVIRMLQSGVKDFFAAAIFVTVLAVFIFFSVSPVWPLLTGAACGIALKKIKREV